jgi:hypothetical protein
MVRMTDIMKDIQEEYNVVEVAFASHVDTVGTEQGATTQMEVREDSTFLDSMERHVSPLRDLVFPIAENLREEEDISLDEHSMENHAIADKRQSSSSPAHDDPYLDTLNHFWPIERRETLANLYTPSTTQHIHSTRPTDFGCTTEDAGGGSGRGKSFVWFCCGCNDGPYGEWQVSCQACGHAKCG